jgi:hypothetical protein
MQIRRKLYRRGSSFETTIPMPLLFAVDTSKKHNVLFEFDQQSNRWYIQLEQAGREEVQTIRRGKKK